MNENRTILIKTTGFHDEVMTYSPNDMMEIYTPEQRQALARGETIRRDEGRSDHVDLVAYYNRTC